MGIQEGTKFQQDGVQEETTEEPMSQHSGDEGIEHPGAEGVPSLSEEYINSSRMEDEEMQSQESDSNSVKTQEIKDLAWQISPPQEGSVETKDGGTTGADDGEFDTDCDMVEMASIPELEVV